MGEAVRIASRGRDTSLLNSRGEYNRCSIVRLSLEQGIEEGKEGTDQGEENLATDWTIGLLKGRDNRDKVEISESTKREGLGAGALLDL